VGQIQIQIQIQILTIAFYRLCAEVAGLGLHAQGNEFRWVGMEAALLESG
jgi:hypothetical protein